MSTRQSFSGSAVSADFKKEVIRSIAAICAFIFVYLLLFVLSICLVGLCCYLGFQLMVLRPSFYTLLGGGGVMLFGIMVFAFLIKFLFSSSKTDDSDSIEITETEQPELFQAINSIAEELKTSKPKKVFLSPDVNACVFYHSSFWSMFLPIRKNLKIGLGLVNSVNASELKAVLAHEFGHFSQKSMKVGSWVYQVNKIIYDMLYNNQGYADFIVSIGKVHSFLSFFANLTIQVVKAIQWVLQKMYGVVNKAYLSLSRQMEFHADLMAASLYGSNNIINSLKRIEFADVCYSSTLNLCNQSLQEKKIMPDFFTSHSIVLRKYAQLNQYSLQNELPVVSNKNSNVTNRLNFKDQWASHPTLTEREQNLELYSLQAKTDERSAWSLFTNTAQLKVMLTEKLYRNVPAEEKQYQLEESEFEQRLNEQIKYYSFPDVFKEFYDGRLVTSFDVEAVSREPFVIKAFEEVFTEEIVLLPKRIELLNQDVITLKAIVNKELVLQTFDFDGVKYKATEAIRILAQAEQELADLKAKLEQADKLVFRYFYAIAPFEKAEGLKNNWMDYFDQRAQSDHFLEKVNALLESMDPIYRGEVIELERINSILGGLKQVDEVILKKLLKEWNDKGAFPKKELQAKVQHFIASDYAYFSGTSFFDHELLELRAIIHESWNSIYDHLFGQFRSIVEVQAGLLKEREVLEAKRV